MSVSTRWVATFAKTSIKPLPAPMTTIATPSHAVDAPAMSTAPAPSTAIPMGTVRRSGRRDSRGAPIAITRTAATDSSVR